MYAQHWYTRGGREAGGEQVTYNPGTYEISTNRKSEVLINKGGLDLVPLAIFAFQVLISENQHLKIEK
jgi:hypothetical protein